MTPFNLLRFAEFSQRIPSKLIFKEQKKKKREILKLFLSHTLDVFTSVIVVSTFVFFFNGHVFDSFQSINNIDQKVILSLNYGFFLLIFPFTIFNYFFFSYFMNHGQTYGMYLADRRIVMESKNFREAFRWAFHSSLLCLSFGLSYFIKRALWENFTDHDYLYNNLFEPQTYPVPINLLMRLDELHSQEQAIASEWKKVS